jgi:hypothetical protein
MIIIIHFLNEKCSGIRKGTPLAMRSVIELSVIIPGKVGGRVTELVPGEVKGVVLATLLPHSSVGGRSRKGSPGGKRHC